MPARGLAWYGRFLRGQQTFLAVDLLADLYPGAGRADDVLRAELGPDAQRVAEVLVASGPTSTAVLRQAAGMEGKSGAARFTRAVTELGRTLMVTHRGVDADGPGWPSAVLDLTSRVFSVPGPGTAAQRRRRALLRFLTTMVAARPAELARAWGGAVPSARAELDGLVAAGVAVREDGWYRPARMLPVASITGGGAPCRT
jgi:hypothetical protein